MLFSGSCAKFLLSSRLAYVQYQGLSNSIIGMNPIVKGNAFLPRHISLSVIRFFTFELLLVDIVKCNLFFSAKDTYETVRLEPV